MNLRIAWPGICIHRQIFPILAGLFLFLNAMSAEPDPGRVDAFGRRITREGKSIQYIRADPGANSPAAKVSPLSPPSQLRAIEAMRTVREWLPEGTLIFKNGRKAAFLGCKPNPERSPAHAKRRKVWERKLPGKVVRLVFDEETRNASGELAAYVFLPDGTLLNEALLREGLCVLDTQAVLSPQYSLRFKAAAEQARSFTPGTEIDAATATQSPKLPEYSRGFTRLSPRSATPLGTKRPGEDQSP